CPGLHTCYNGKDKGLPLSDKELIPKTFSQFGLESATRLHEAGIASNRRSECYGEYVPGPCTHRPSSHGSRVYLKSVTARSCLGSTWWLGLSRNKVAVSEGAAGIPPF